MISVSMLLLHPDEALPAYRMINRERDPGVIPDLLRIVQNPEAPAEARRLALDLLRNFAVYPGLPVPEEILLALLEEEEIRGGVIPILAYMKSRQAIPRLAALLTDGDGRERELAAWALGEIGDPEGIPALARALEDEMGAAAAYSALARMGRRAPEAVAGAMLRVLRESSSPRARGYAVMILGEIAPEDPAWANLARQDPDESVRALARIYLK